MSILGLFKRQSFTERPERQTLTVPIHEKIDRAESQPVLEAAAGQLAKSGLLWKWLTCDNTAKLVRWDQTERAFLRGSLDDWCHWFGQRFIVRDSSNQEYLGPSPVVADRLISAVLSHPQLPTATWTLQLQKRGTK